VIDGADAGRRIVIGIGNPDRGDDAAGREVLRQLRGLLPADVNLVEGNGEAAAVLAWLERAEMAILVDASHSGAPAGTLRRFDVTQAPLPAALFEISTHGFGLGAAVELARALGQLPRRCIVYAIEGAGFELGAPLSPDVAAAIPEVVARLRAELADLDSPPVPAAGAFGSSDDGRLTLA